MAATLGASLNKAFFVIFTPSVQRVFLVFRGLGRRFFQTVVLGAGLTMPILPALAAPIFVLN